VQQLAFFHFSSTEVDQFSVKTIALAAPSILVNQSAR
jgi:hypothetical protein